MATSGPNPITQVQKQLGCVIIPLEANKDAPLKGDFERMARRRFQNPRPFRREEQWCLLTWEDVFREGKIERKRKWHKLAPATMLEREARKQPRNLYAR